MGYSSVYVSDEVAPSSILSLGPETTKHLSVTEFRNQIYIHIRNFLPSLSKNGLLKPMIGGVSLTVARWNQLVINIGNIEREIDLINNRMTIKKRFYHRCSPISLGSDTKLCVAAVVHEGEIKIHIREYTTYEKEIDGVLVKTGKQYPTPKGIALNVNEWNVLITNARDYIEARIPYISMATQTTNFEYADQNLHSTHTTPPRIPIDSEVKTERQEILEVLAALETDTGEVEEEEEEEEEELQLLQNQNEDGNIKQELRNVVLTRQKRTNNIPLPTQTPKKARKVQRKKPKLERQNALDGSTTTHHLGMLDPKDIENYFANLDSQLAEEPQAGRHTAQSPTNKPECHGCFNKTDNPEEHYEGCMKHILDNVY